jgi:hypothetical protein
VASASTRAVASHHLLLREFMRTILLLKKGVATSKQGHETRLARTAPPLAAGSGESCGYLFSEICERMQASGARAFPMAARIRDSGFDNRHLAPGSAG